jgi:hypothetical protein
MLYFRLGPPQVYNGFAPYLKAQRRKPLKLDDSEEEEVESD